MKSTAHISVVIPSYNYGRYLRTAVDSALAQTARPMEILVIDDGSQDDTREVMQAYVPNPYVHYIYQENRGLSAARNTGILAATGEWVAFLDSDDAWHPQKLERVTHVIEKNPELSAVSSDNVCFETVLPEAERLRPDRQPLKSIGLRDLVYGVPFSGGSGAVVRRECFQRVGLFDESLRAVEDLEMWLRIAARYPMVRLQEPLNFVRVHATSMSAKADLMEQNHQKVVDKVFAHIPELRGKWLWKRVATARLHRGVAIMHFEAGNRLAGRRSLRRSISACPWTSGQASWLVRLRMLVRYCR